MMFIMAERLPLILALAIGLLCVATYHLLLSASIGYLAGLSVAKQVYNEQLGKPLSVTDGYEQSSEGD